MDVRANEVAARSRAACYHDYLLTRTLMSYPDLGLSQMHTDYALRVYDPLYIYTQRGDTNLPRILAFTKNVKND